MYSINDKVDIPLTKEYLLSLYTEEDIFSLVFKDSIDLDIKYKSPFRKDNNPGCYFKRDYKNKLWFVDFANDTFQHLDCFNAVQIYYNFYNFQQTLIFIKNSLLKKNVKQIENKNINIISKIIEKEKKEIYIKPRDFINQDKIFWNKYEISKQNLIDDLILPVTKFKIITDTNIKEFDCNYITYSFGEFKKNRKKLYLPYNKPKFISTCIKDDIGALNYLNKNKNYVLITKSYKDCRIIRNLGINSIWFQNETSIPSKNTLEDILKPFKNIFIFYDNDFAGIKGSENLKKVIETNFSIKTLNISLPLNTKCKDSGEVLEKINKKFLIQFLIEKTKININ